MPQTCRDFADASFDAVVISFNGIDCVFPEERRWQCLRECGRVLRAGGVFIFSSHNPRSIFLRPAWNRDRLRALPRSWFRRGAHFHEAAFAILTVAKAVHSFLRATGWVGRGGSASRLPKPLSGGVKATCSILPTGA